MKKQYNMELSMFTSINEFIFNKCFNRMENSVSTTISKKIHDMKKNLQIIEIRKAIEQSFCNYHRATENIVSIRSKRVYNKY